MIFPQQKFILIEIAISTAIIKQNHFRTAGNQPAPVMASNSLGAEAIQCPANDAVGGQFFKFNRRRLWVVGADEGVAIPPSLRATAALERRTV